MSRSHESPGARLRQHWARLSPLPGGRRLFSILLGRLAPYTGSMGATVERFEPGHVLVALRDRRKIRNHLGSIHAVALANLGELSTGLSVVGALGPGSRGILTGLEVQYLKKARGRLVAEARCEPPQEVTGDVDFPVEAEIRDGGGDTVARVRALWRLSPTRPR